MTSQQEGLVSVTLQSAVQKQGHSKDPPQSFCLAFWHLTRTEMFCPLFCSTVLSWSLKEHTSWPHTMTLNPLPLTTGRHRVQAKPSGPTLHNPVVSGTGSSQHRTGTGLQHLPVLRLGWTMNLRALVTLIHQSHSRRQPRPQGDVRSMLSQSCPEQCASHTQTGTEQAARQLPVSE